MNLWLTQWLCPGAQDLWLQNKPKSKPFHLRAWRLCEVFVLEVLMCCDWFSPTMALCIMTKHHHFCLICPKDVTPQVLWLIYKSSPCCHVQEKGRPPGQPSYLQGEFFLFRPFLIVQSWTLKLNSSRVWEIALRFLWYCVNTHVNAPDECTHKILFL